MSGGEESEDAVSDFPAWLEQQAAAGVRLSAGVVWERFEEWYTEAPLDLVGVSEAAEILGVEKTRLPRWLRKKYWLVPEPVARLKGTPVWRRVQIDRLRDDLAVLASGSMEERDDLKRRRAATAAPR